MSDANLDVKYELKSCIIPPKRLNSVDARSYWEVMSETYAKVSPELDFNYDVARELQSV